MLSLCFTIMSIGLLILQMQSDRRKGQFNILNVSYLFQVYYIVQLPISSLFAEMFGLSQFDSRVNTTISMSTRLDVLCIAFIGQLFFILGSLLVRNVVIKGKEQVKEWPFKRVAIMIVALICLGYFLFFRLMKEYGGISRFIYYLEYWRNKGLVGKGAYTMGIARLMPVSIALYMIYFKDEIRNNKKLIGLLAITGACMVPISILGFRSYVLNVLIILITIYHLKIKRIKYRYLGFGIVAFAIYFSFYSIARTAGSFDVGTLKTVTQSLGNTFQKLLLRSRGSEVVGMAMDQIKAGVGHRYTMEMLSTPFANIIPRAIWPDKPESMTTLFPVTFFQSYGIKTGISPTCIGELYWEWGILGVCVGMITLGICMRIVQNNLLNTSLDDNHLLTYAILLWPLIFMAETISGSLNILVILSILLIGMKYFLNFKIMAT